jgi:hypothetical protein
MVGDPLVIAEKARARLRSVVTSLREGRRMKEKAILLPSSADVVVTPCEVNELHGTGTLLFRIFSDSSSIVSLRSSNFYDVPQVFGAANFCLPLARVSRAEIAAWVKWWLAGTSVRRVICFPYLPADPIVALAVREAFNVPLCTYIMDDKNVCAEGISDSLMQELLSKSRLRLVISPEMRLAYTKKYGMKFWLLPPLVPEQMIRRNPVHSSNGNNLRRGVLLGNIWGQRWLDALRAAIRTSGYQVDWYCNHKNPRSLVFDRAEMEQDGIRLLDPVAEADLPAILSKYSYAVVPSDTLDGQSPPSVQAIAELSLPSRIPTILATSHLPILVLGNARTSAGRFVERFQIGAVAAYEADAVRTALDRLLKPESQARIRNRAAALSDSFSAEGSADWIWSSLKAGEACDPTYEELIPYIHEEELLETATS